MVVPNGHGQAQSSSSHPPPDAPVHQFGTLAVHAGSPIDPVTGAVIEPISLSTTYAQTSPANPLGLYEYTRSSNPNRTNFETAIASLEHGTHALAFSSGSATTAVILQSLPPSSHVISVSDVYGGTHRYFTQVASAHGVSVTFTANIEQDLEKLVRKEGEHESGTTTRLIWVETPSNPTLSLVDISAVSNLAHKHSLKVVVDNTFLSPYLQNPLVHGADLVMHSVTKYINGHSDVLMGVLTLNDETWFSKLKFLQNAIGAVPSAFDCWLAHRGLKTLHLRAREASLNAAMVAEALQASPHVLLVNYPGLKSSPYNHIARKQHRDGHGGGMLSFRLRGGKEAAAAFASATKIFTLAESLGGVESLVEIPSLMTHAGIPRADREASGVWDDLVRLSCGVEDGRDLVRDVMDALEVVEGGKNGVEVNGNGNGHGIENGNGNGIVID